jgi:hypothetical protein
MGFVLFHSTKHADLVIYADSEARVSELPAESGPWRSYGDIGDLPLRGSERDGALKLIRSRGWCFVGKR